MRVLYLLVAPQLLGVLALVALRRAPSWAPVVASTLLASGAATIAMMWDVRLDTHWTLHPDAYRCGLSGLAMGLMSFIVGGMHAMVAFVIAVFAIVPWRTRARAKAPRLG